VTASVSCTQLLGDDDVGEELRDLLLDVFKVAAAGVGNGTVIRVTWAVHDLGWGAEEGGGRQVRLALGTWTSQTSPAVVDIAAGHMHAPCRKCGTGDAAQLSALRGRVMMVRPYYDTKQPLTSGAWCR